MLTTVQGRGLWRIGRWVVALLLIAGCSGGGGGSGSEGDSGSGGDGGGGTSLTLRTTANGTATLEDGTYETACRTCKDPSTCSDKDRIVVSGSSFTFTTFTYTDLVCTMINFTEGPTSATAVVGGTQAAGCYLYTPTPGGLTVPSCEDVGLSGSPTASDLTLSISGGGTFKTLAIVETASPTMSVYLADDRGAGTPCETTFCTELSTFAWIKQ